MSVLALPVRTDLPSYTSQIVLEGVPLIFRLAWSHRAQAWAMSFLTRDRVPLLMGIRVVVGAQLMGTYARPGLPRGEVLAIPRAGSTGRIARHDLGSRVELVYITSDTVEGALSSAAL